MNWVDLLLICLMGFNVVRGMRKGLIMTLFSLGSYLAAWWASVKYSDRLAAMLMQADWIQDRIYDWAVQKVEKQDEWANGGHLLEESLQDSLLSLPLPEVAKAWIREPGNGISAAEGVESWAVHQAALAMTHLLMSFLAFVVLFFAVKQLVYVAGLVIHGIFKLPVLSLFNKAGGLAAGLVRGLVLAAILAVLTSPFTASDPNGMIAVGLRNSWILEYLFTVPFG